MRNVSVKKRSLSPHFAIHIARLRACRSHQDHGDREQVYRDLLPFQVWMRKLSNTRHFIDTRLTIGHSSPPAHMRAAKQALKRVTIRANPARLIVQETVINNRAAKGGSATDGK